MPIKKRKLIKDQNVSDMDDNEFLEMLRKFNERADKELKEYHCMICMGYAIQSQVNLIGNVWNVHVHILLERVDVTYQLMIFYNMKKLQIIPAVEN